MKKVWLVFAVLLCLGALPLAAAAADDNSDEGDDEGVSVAVEDSAEERKRVVAELGPGEGTSSVRAAAQQQQQQQQQSQLLLPVWAVAAVCAGSVAAAVGAALIVLAAMRLRQTSDKVSASSGYVSLDNNNNSKRWHIVLAVGCVVAALGLAAVIASLVVALQPVPAVSIATRSGQVQLNGPVLAIPIRKVSATGVPYSELTFFTYVRDERGRQRAVIVGNDSPAVRGSSGQTTRLPINRKLTGSGTIGPDGILRIDNWAVRPGQRDGVISTGTRTLIAYRVTFSGTKPCGSITAPEDCATPCTMQTIQSMIISGPNSVSALYSLLSNGGLSLTGSVTQWVDVTIPAGTTVLDIPKVVDATVGERDGDFFAFFLPSNFRRDQFSGGAVGLGTVGASYSWMVRCDSQVFAHEWAHNLNLMHAGAWTPAGQFNEYADVTSVMSYALVGDNFGPYRGLAAAQMSQMNWLPSSAVLDIQRNGDYTINSLTSRTGVRAARILFPGATTVWVEWREATGFDKDLAQAQVFINDQQVQNAGQIIGGILVKTVAPDGKSQLVGITDASGDAVRFSNGLSVLFLSRGRFRVQGLPGGPADTTTTTTTDGETQTTTTRRPAGPPCASGLGSCIDVSSCDGTVRRGLCPGASNIACCIPSAPATTTTTKATQTQATTTRPAGPPCASGLGSCIDVSTCDGTVRRGLCPGASNIACCIPSAPATTTTTKAATASTTRQQTPSPRPTGPACTTPRGGGVCISTSTCASVSGTTFAGLCAGPANIKCCVF